MTPTNQTKTGKQLSFLLQLIDLSMEMKSNKNTPNCQPLLHLFYGKIASQPISYTAKLFFVTEKNPLQLRALIFSLPTLTPFAYFSYHCKIYSFLIILRNSSNSWHPYLVPHLLKNTSNISPLT